MKGVTRRTAGNYSRMLLNALQEIRGRGAVITLPLFTLWFVFFLSASSDVTQLQGQNCVVAASPGLPWASGFYLILINFYLPLRKIIIIIKDLK